MFWQSIIDNLPTLATVFAFGILLIGVIGLLYGAVYFLMGRIENQYKENAENIKSIKKSNEYISQLIYDFINETKNQRKTNEKTSRNDN